MFKFISKTTVGLIGVTGLLTVGFLAGSALICYCVGDTTEFGKEIINDCKEFKKLVDEKHIDPYKKKQLHKETEKINEETSDDNVTYNDYEPV